jgi:membrane associated rhomboid family serine protease
MFPLRDENPTQRTPFINYLLLAANVVAFAVEFSLIGKYGHSWVVPGYGLVPTRLMADPTGESFTVFTSMFMHGDLAHLGGNLLFLYIFGDNIEDALGHLRYVGFYLLGGIGAAVTQVAIDPGSTVPMVGASGAIAGVLGGYMVLYPRAPILVLNPVLPLWLIFGAFLTLPAWLVVGEWFIFNVLSGVSSLTPGAKNSVAFFAHIGGFVVGMVTIKLFSGGRPQKPTQNWHGWRPPRSFGSDRYNAPRPGPGRWDPFR